LGGHGSIIGVVVLAFVVGTTFLLLFPALNRAREAARRTHCKNNLKQQALAIHNYHDTYNELPPLATDDKHWSWMALVLPFIEASPTYQQIQQWAPADDARHLPLVRQFRTTTFLCASRRTAETLTRSGGIFDGAMPTDYVAVSTTQGTTWGPNTDGMIVFRLEPPTEDGGRARSAIKLGRLVVQASRGARQAGGEPGRGRHPAPG
jgi:hypothetical protein